ASLCSLFLLPCRDYRSLLSFPTRRSSDLFDDVIHACSLPRSDGFNDALPEGEHTWIHSEMIDAYTELHAQGFAHSIEVWDDKQQLIGGLYGLKIGGIYFGESMFHVASNASKLAFWGLMRLCEQSHVQLVDCQLD